MKYYKKTDKLSDKDFKQIIGVKKETFNIMVEILKSAYIQKHKKRWAKQEAYDRRPAFNDFKIFAPICHSKRVGI